MAINTNELKSQHNLIGWAERYTTLNKESSTEYSGPCPKCGGEDRFHVTRDSFFCRQCFPLGNGQPHDAIAFVQFVGLAGNFREACDLLGKGSLPKAERRQPEAKKEDDAWKSPLWQREVTSFLADAQDRLWNRPEGEPGRAYLAGRGFREDVALAFDLGYADVWHKKRGENKPAIILPWQNRQVTAVQYRYIDLEGDERFSQKVGGRRYLFGLQLFRWTDADTLILCEGELNACALWQETSQVFPAHIASWGSESNIAQAADLVRKLAPKYKRVLVWADERDRAMAAKSILGLPQAMALWSPGSKDANDLLQAGHLRPMLERAFAHYDQSRTV